MATMFKRGEMWSVQFMLDGERKTVSLKTKSERTATGCKLHIGAIVSARQNGLPIDPPTAAWITGLSAKFRGRLERAGLLDRPKGADDAITLSVLLERYFKSRRDVKPSTKLVWSNAKRNLIAYFGADRDIATITAGDAKDFERWLRTGDARMIGGDGESVGLQPDTARKRIAICKMIFADGVDREWIVRNPFDKLNSTMRGNRSRDYFVTPDDAQKVLDACPDGEWRLLFALSRWGGLRCPSEHLALTWDCVDWERGRLLVRSVKTEHHEGKAERWVPLFPELRPYLEAAFDAAEPGATFIIATRRESNVNLRTQLCRIIRRAGLTPWPKLFANLRSSRATELAKEYPGYVAAAWLGHSEKIATKHYWQVTDNDFDRAAGIDALQKRCSIATQPAESTPFRGNKPQENVVNNRLVAAAGLEPARRLPSKGF